MSETGWVSTLRLVNQFDFMAEPFIFREAAPGQQAVQYAQLQAQQEMDQNRLNNDLYRAMSQQATQLGIGSQQAAISRNQMLQRQAENEKDRELTRQGYTNAQTVAGITAGPRDDAIKARQAADAADLKQRNRDLWSMGDAYEKTVNSPDVLKMDPAVVKRMKESGHLYRGDDGLWHNRYPNPDAVVESIGDIRQRYEGIPGSMGVGGKLMPGINSMPPRSMMLNRAVPVSDFPSAPPGPSPFETDGFRVFRQSDFSEVPEDNYDRAVRFNSPVAVPVSEFQSTDYQPKSRVPYSFLPY
jgi:hypothetical protein